MAEPPAEPRQPPPGPPSDSEVVRLGANEALALSLDVEPSDDSPTIISRPSQTPAPRPEEAFTSTLRGRHLAHFELVEPIGVGGMAAVIRARDRQLDRSVALKILPPEMSANPENVRRFQQEARAAAKLDHENIARVFYCGEDQGLHFISFEFVEGANLRTILERRGRLPVPEAVHYLLQVASGLVHAAGRGVVHRDIKPSNIIISPNGRAKLVDMGLARSLEPQADHGLTESGVTLGTFDYISPEQALDPHEADGRSDIYSLGCTFYHMVTGQAPFPEGTAAKKLNQHQHAAPVDPRQLIPEIPDEVAVILNRMMAKNPKDRYQEPEHLVQHLLQLAQKLGASTEAPDGVLFVDTPLPSPPRMRPLVVTIVAGFFLAALVLLHSMSPWHSTSQTVERVVREGVGLPVEPKADLPQGPTDRGSPTITTQSPEVPQPLRRDIRTARELTDFLKAYSSQSQNPVAEITLVNDIDLTQESHDINPGQVPGLFFQGDGRRLTIQGPKTSRKRPTIRLVYDPDLGDEGDVWTALTIEGGKVTLDNLRFVVNATQAKIVMTALKLRQRGQVDVKNCEFLQLNPPNVLATNSPGADGRLSSVVVESLATVEHSRPKLTLTECYFGIGQETGRGQDSGQEAVSLDDAASVTATNCAFGPHAVLFHLRDRSRDRTTLDVRHCSAFLPDGSAFQVEADAACTLKVQDCLFSRPDTSAGMLTGSAVLIQQAGENPSNIRYEGAGNRYHNLSAFWQRPAPAEPVSPLSGWDLFQRDLDANQGKDDKSLVLSVSPWMEKNPLQTLNSGLPDRAFRVDPTSPQLRQLDNPQLVVGLERCTWGLANGGRLPALETAPATAAMKIVDPEAKQIGNGVYPTLGQAIADARPQDVILIRHSGLLPVEPVALEKSAIDVTIKPYPGKRPILTLARTPQVDAPLFRLHDGKLKLEDLEFLLSPDRQQFEAQAVVTVVGAGECQLTNCVATLDKSEKVEAVHLALVSVIDPKDVMKMEPRPARPAPEIQINRCFVRGRGELVAVRGSRPFNLNVQHSLVVLAGSFLSVDGNPKELPATPNAQITLSHLTVYLTEHLVCLRACKEEGKSGKGLVLTQIVSAANCLFASAGGKSLVHLDGVDSDEQMKRFFAWDEGKDNVYSNFNPMLDQQPRGEAMPLMPYDRVKWEIFTQEVGKYERVKFLSAPGADGPLARALPADFRVKADGGADPQECGAAIDKVPRPNPSTGN